MMDDMLNIVLDHTYPPKTVPQSNLCILNKGIRLQDLEWLRVDLLRVPDFAQTEPIPRLCEPEAAL